MRMRRKRIGWLASAAVLAAALAGCVNEGADGATAVSAPPSSVRPAESEAPSATAVPFTAPTEATLAFVPVTSKQVADKRPLGQAPAATVLERDVPGGKLVVYAKPGDEENAYAQFRTADASYELGAVGGLPRGESDLELLSATPLELYGRQLVRIDGVFGADAPVRNYFALEGGAIEPFLLVDTGHAEEVDLDGDGVPEIVATGGLPMFAYVYRYKDGRFEMADVNAALGAQAVVWDGNENLFKAQLAAGETRHANYRYTQGKLEATA